MINIECVSNLLQVCTQKTKAFLWKLENEHMMWLLEMEEEAKRLLSIDFSGEPELMPKTPSQKRRRKARTSIVSDENRNPSRRTSRRRSSASWSASVRRFSTRHQNKLDLSIKEVPEIPKRVTRAQASMMIPVVTEEPLPEPSVEVNQSKILIVNISAELQLSDAITNSSKEPTETPVSETEVLPVPVTPEIKGLCATKLNIADASTPKQIEERAQTEAMEESEDHKEALKDNKVTPTGSRSDRRSVRRSLVGLQSNSHRASLVTQYSLASKRESMTRKAVRKSIRRSLSKKKAMETSSSSNRSCQSSIEEEDTIQVRPEPMTCEEEDPVPQSARPSLRSLGSKDMAISNQPYLPQRLTRQTVAATAEIAVEDAQIIRRNSYKQAVYEPSNNNDREDETELFPVRKKTPCHTSKVVKPPPQMKNFLHTVQKNKLLSSGSIGKNMVKSFLKRNTPVKTDTKNEEKERQRQEALRKKEEAELQRKQKIEDGKKRKQEELKLRREERLRKVLQARERVEQMEEEKKKKIEQKFAQIDEKSEKLQVQDDRMAEEKVRKKVIAKKQEELESRCRQEEEALELKAKQIEEKERKHRNLLQRKCEKEQEKQKKIVEAKRHAEQRQVEQERERESEQQVADEKEQACLHAEKEYEPTEMKALQLQKELEHVAQEKTQQLREVEELKDKNSPALYQVTPQARKPHSPKTDNENYGLDINSDDCTDDESQPRKPIPNWASGNLLAQAMRQQYYNPIDVECIFGTIHSPKLEDIFYKNKPRYFKRTSSAVWHSIPAE